MATRTWCVFDIFYYCILYYGIMNPTLQWRIWPRAKIVSTKWIPHAPRYKMVMLIPSSYIGQQPPWASSSMQHPLKVSVQRHPISTAKMYARNRLAEKSLWSVAIRFQPALFASLIPHHSACNTRQVHNLMRPRTFIGRGATSMILLPWGHLFGKKEDKENAAEQSRIHTTCLLTAQIL